MASTLVVSNFQTGYETDRESFLINNDAFPNLINAYVWRGRVRKKRGTQLLGRLQRKLTNQSLGNTSGAGALSVNLITLLSLNIGSSIVTGSITVTIGADIFTEPATPNGTLVGSTIGSGTINYSTGALTITGGPAATPVTITFSYYPNLPVMGLEDFEVNIVNFPTLVSFDTKFSYQFTQSVGPFYDTTFYKNSSVPFQFSGADYQQFYSVNFSGAMWVTNGNPGFHFKVITGMPVVGPNSQFTIANHGLSNTDYVYINEVVGVTGVNGVSGLVTVVDANNFTIPTPGAAGAYVSGGIAQYITRSVGVQDGIRWYDGDNTADSTKGWVNFSPPLSNAVAPSYLVGAKLIAVFKDRILFFATYTQTSAGSTIFNPNQIVWCQNGTPYYSNPAPVNQSVDNSAWFQNVVGRGGRLNIGFSQQIITVDENEDVLLVGLEAKQTKLFYTADDTNPFILQTINSELGAQSTFSSITLDKGAMSIGDYGIALTTQYSAQRIDLKIPDQVFSIRTSTQGAERTTAIRDFRNEFVYFTYPPINRTDAQYIFPSQSLLYNYRDNTWAILDENYTKYGTFRRQTGYTWATIGTKYATWAAWTDPWNFGSQAAQYPNIVGGNQQGFVMIKDDGVKEDNSAYISNISGSTITSPNHCLNDGADADYILISGAIGVNFSDGFPVNSKVCKVLIATQNSFTVDASFTGTYLGGAVFIRLTNFFVQTKQFQLAWDKARQTRIGTQRFLIENTSSNPNQSSQITVSINTNQDDDFVVNDPLVSSYLIYSDIVLTGAEPNNPLSASQQQVWHRMSNSFNGDTVQIGFTLSDAQMRNMLFNSSEFALHAIAIDLYPGPILY